MMTIRRIPVKEVVARWRYESYRRDLVLPSFGRSVRRFSTLFIIALIVLLTGSLYAGDPWEFWVKGKLVAKASENFRASAELTSKFNDGGDNFYKASDWGLVYVGVAHWLDLGVYYKSIFRNVDNPGQEDVWQHENRPHLNATARFELFGIVFSDRIQVEYNSFEDLSNYGTFRNQIAINPPNYLEPLRERKVLKQERIRPFASYEIFITSADGVSKHRLEAGLSVKCTKRVFTDLYYMRQEKSNFDSGTNIAGLTLKLLF